MSVTQLFISRLRIYVILVTAGDVGEITSVSLSKKGKDDWKVAHVIVVKQGSNSPKSHFFNFNNQLITQEGISVYSN